MIHYLMHVDQEGDIQQIRIAKGYNPADQAIDPDNGLYCIHYMAELEDVGEWHETHAWDFANSQWTTRNKRPNNNAYWEDNQWKWDSDKLLAGIKELRTYRLLETDWAILPDSPLSDSQLEEVKAYRTALRDLPANLDMSVIDSYDAVIWPAVPSFLGTPKQYF